MSRTSATAANTRCSGPRASDTSSSCSGTAVTAFFSARGHRSRIGVGQGRELGLRPLQADAVTQPANRGQRVVLFVGVPRQRIGDPRGDVRREGIGEARGGDRRPLRRSRRSAGPCGRRRAGSAPKRVRQTASLSTTRRVPVSSSRSNSRPSGSAARSVSEVPARDRQDAQPLGPSVDDQVEAGLGIVRERRHLVERRRLLTDEREVRAGEHASGVGAVGLAAGTGGPAVPARRMAAAPAAPPGRC